MPNSIHLLFIYHVNKGRNHVLEEETKGSTDPHYSCTQDKNSQFFLLNASMFITCCCTYTITDYLAAGGNRRIPASEDGLASSDKDREAMGFTVRPGTAPSARRTPLAGRSRRGRPRGGRRCWPCRGSRGGSSCTRGRRRSA